MDGFRARFEGLLAGALLFALSAHVAAAACTQKSEAGDL